MKFAKIWNANRAYSCNYDLERALGMKTRAIRKRADDYQIKRETTPQWTKFNWVYQIDLIVDSFGIVEDFHGKRKTISLTPDVKVGQIKNLGVICLWLKAYGKDYLVVTPEHNWRSSDLRVSIPDLAFDEKFDNPPVTMW